MEALSFPVYANLLFFLKAWDIVCSHTLFDGRNPDGVFDDRVHLAELVALLGPPPPEFRKRGKLSSVFWDQHGISPVSVCTPEFRLLGFFLIC